MSKKTSKALPPKHQAWVQARRRHRLLTPAAKLGPEVCGAEFVALIGNQMHD